MGRPQETAENVKRAPSAHLGAKETSFSIKKIQVNSQSVDLDRRCSDLIEPSHDLAIRDVKVEGHEKSAEAYTLCNESSSQSFFDLIDGQCHTDHLTIQVEASTPPPLKVEIGSTTPSPCLSWKSKGGQDRKCFAEEHISGKLDSGGTKMSTFRRDGSNRSLDLPFHSCTRSMLNLFQGQRSSRQSSPRVPIPTPPPRRIESDSITSLPSSSLKVTAGQDRECFGEDNVKLNSGGIKASSLKRDGSNKSLDLPFQSQTRSLLNLFQAQRSSRQSSPRVPIPTPSPQRVEKDSVTSLPSSCLKVSVGQDRKCFGEDNISGKLNSGGIKVSSLKRDGNNKSLDLPFQSQTRSLLNLFQAQRSSRQSSPRVPIPTPPPRRRQGGSVNNLPHIGQKDSCREDKKNFSTSEFRNEPRPTKLLSNKLSGSGKSLGLSFQSCTQSMLNLFRDSRSSPQSSLKIAIPTPPPRRRRAASVNHLPTCGKKELPGQNRIYFKNGGQELLVWMKSSSLHHNMTSETQKLPFQRSTPSLVDPSPSQILTMTVKVETSEQKNNTKSSEDQHNMVNGRRHHIHESEYEEIGPPALRSPQAKAMNGMTHNQLGLKTANSPPCDLCGTASAMVRCQQCSDQVFCLSCDDMYHKHPKRSSHQRKAVPDTSIQQIRPPLPPKGDSSIINPPVAPPRRNLRKGSTPDSPFSGRQMSTGPQPLANKENILGMSRSSTLPRKIGSSSMTGRPLPPPPPPNTIQSNSSLLSQQSREPRLMRSNSMAQPPALPSRAPVTPMSSIGGQDMRKPFTMQTSGFGHRNQPEIPMPGQTNSFHGFGQQQPHHLPSHTQPLSQQQLHLQHQQQQLNSSQFIQRAPSMAKSVHSQMGSRQYPQAFSEVDGSYHINGLNREDQWLQNPSIPYHEEVQFPPQQNFPGRPMMFEGVPQGSQTLSRRSAVQSKSRNRFSKLNKSSSLHDIVQGLASNQNFMNPDGVTWEDQHWTTQSQIHRPSLTMAEIMQQNGNFKRATSTKSLHQLAEPWNAWDSEGFMMQQQGYANPMRQNFNPMMNRWIAGHQMFNPLPGNGIHRSMHDLNFAYPSNVNPNSPGSSQKSSRSKKSSVKSSERKPSSSRLQRKSGNDSRPQSRSSRQRRGQSSRRAESSDEDDLEQLSINEEEEEEENEEEEDEEEDFYTGESDSDFVSLSSGSNSRRAPRKSWICEHCTYMNNPGVTVCTVCCRTSKMSRGEEEPQQEKSPHFIAEETTNGKSNNKVANNSKNSQKYRNRKKYNSSDDDDSEENSKSRQKSSTLNGKSNSSTKKRPSNKSGKMNRQKTPENVSDLERDAHKTYYAVRMESKNYEGQYESSSEASNQNSSSKRPSFETPAPAKGILKKSNSNPQLTKIEQDAKSDIGQMTRKLEKHLAPIGPGKVVDIKKYLAQTQDNPKLAAKNGHDYGSGDIWKDEQTSWMRQNDDEMSTWRQKPMRDDSPARSTTANAPENDYMSDVASQSSRMYRSISGQSLGDMESQLQDHLFQTQLRRISDVSGKKNFRSKRFSRNLERDVKDPSVRRSHSLHVDRPRDGDRWFEVQSGVIKKPSHRQSNKSESSSEETSMHFTATVEGETRGPRAIGSYLSRREFGTVENGTSDSGYLSHSSGSHYPRVETQGPIESFTMSVDRGFLGRGPGEHGHMYKSMDDLTVQKTKGLELVRLLREAEQSGYTAEDIQVSLNHCGDVNPVLWLKENWDNMMDTVVTLASNVGHEAEENTIGTLSKVEARDALRKHKGNIWAAVTECVETRQLKYDELCSKGNFSCEDIVTALTTHQGNVEAAFQELNKASLKPFFMRIWGQAEPAEVNSGTINAKEKVEETEATIILNEPGGSKKHSNVSEDHYQPGNLIKTIDIPQQTTKSHPEPSAEDLEKFKFDRQVRRLLAEGQISSYEKGEMVVKLQELEFPEDEALVAVEHCEDIYTAMKFLRQECELCANIMNVKEIISMPDCNHKCCRDCAAKHFTIVIKDRSIAEARCPFCNEPSNLENPEDDDMASAYLAKLDILLKSILEQDVHDLFQRKLRDRTLMKDPNFKWCYKCSSGFIADPRNKKLVCPDCRAISCAKCLKPWETQHEAISCEEFASWKDANDPDNQAKGLERHLEENGIECPACKFKYALTKGGCMHFTCSQCKHEFCIGCNKPFKLGVKCGKGPGCAKMGLHSHHPRNCLFYLRDKEPEDLQKLLKSHKVEFLTEVDGGGTEHGEPDIEKCRVQIQREVGSDGLLKDEACGEPAPKEYARFCKIHYVEYLCGLIFRHSVEPVGLLDLGELQQVFARANHFMPRQRPGEYEYQYKKRLSQVIQNEIPLEST